MLNALHGHLDRWRDAAQLLEEAHSSRASANTGERALRSFARARHWLRAVKCWDWDGLIDRSFGEVVQALPTWWLTLHYLTTFGGGNMVTCTTSIRKCETSWQQATNLLQSLQSSRIRLDAQVFGAALVSLVSVKKKSWQAAVQLVEEMTCVALEKNVIIRSEMMRVLSSEWWKSAELLVDADLVGFSTLIDAFEKVGAWIQAATLLAQLRSEGLRLDQVLLNSCCSVAQKAAVWRQSLQLLRSELLQLTPNLLTYSASISAAGATGGHWTQALHIGNRARQTLRSLDTVIHNAMISAVEKASFQWPQAFQIYSNLRPSTVTCNALLSACENARAWERAFVTVDVLQGMGLEPQLVTFNAAISSCQGSPWPRGLKVLKEMTQRQYLPDDVTMDALGAVCKATWQQAMYVTSGTAGSASARAVRTAVVAREQGRKDAVGSVRLMSQLSDPSKLSNLT